MALKMTGKNGGTERARKLSPARRSEIARIAAICRWHGNLSPELRPALCPPAKRIAGTSMNEWIRMIRWHERQAEQAMNSLSCGSENWEYSEADKAADAHWKAAALMRLVIGRED